MTIKEFVDFVKLSPADDIEIVVITQDENGDEVYNSISQIVLSRDSDGALQVRVSL